ncbi:MAG: hypothetical protein M0C28_13555 [Candidatus Moduliflexus flocculans]|nr:hypothetical protein [Candidatus Moduliflexus flocculans]
MVGAFLYLTACSFKNRLRRRLQRLREPRYIVGLVVGLLLLLRRVLPPQTRRRRPCRRLADGGGAGRAGAARRQPVPVQRRGHRLGLAVGPARRCRSAAPRCSSSFTAPVTRRQLVHYKLLAVAARHPLRQRGRHADPAARLPLGRLDAAWRGLWLVLVTLRLHLMGVALRRLSLASARRARRSCGSGCRLAVVVGAVGVLAKAMVDAWPAADVAHGRSGRRSRSCSGWPGRAAGVGGPVAVPGAGPPAAGGLGRRVLVALPAGARHPRAELRLGAAVGRGVRGGVGGARRAAGGRRAARPRAGGEGRGRDAVHARAWTARRKRPSSGRT